jgi:hypothetical protein
VTGAVCDYVDAMLSKKPRMRLPSDTGPNPYDSSTPIKETQPRWLWDWKWWVAIIAIGTIMYLLRVWNGTA